MLVQIIQGVALVAAIVLVAALLSYAYRLLISDPLEYESNRNRNGTVLDALKGKVRTSHDGIRDFRVRAGIAVNRKTNEWEEQGTLSEDAVDAILDR